MAHQVIGARDEFSVVLLITVLMIYFSRTASLIF